MPAMNVPGSGHPQSDGATPEPAEPAAAESASAPASAPTRRPSPEELDRVFGTVLPDVTSDERGLADSRGDDWYLGNRPPHHG